MWYVRVRARVADIALHKAGNICRVSGRRFRLNVILEHVSSQTLVIAADEGVVDVQAGAMDGEEAEEPAALATQVTEIEQREVFVLIVRVSGALFGGVLQI